MYRGRHGNRCRLLPDWLPVRDHPLPCFAVSEVLSGPPPSLPPSRPPPPGPLHGLLLWSRFVFFSASRLKLLVRQEKSAAGIIYVPVQGRRGHNLTNVWGQLVSQGDATEKLAHQVAAPVAAAHRRVEEASGDPHEEEKDEAHKSSKGHVSGPAAGCPTSPEAPPGRIHADMQEAPRAPSSPPRQRAQTQEPQSRRKPGGRPQRLRPPD